MLEDIKTTENSLIFVNFMTGITTAILIILLSVILKINSSNIDPFFIDLKFSGIDILFAVISVFVGFFIYGIRYYFFELYRIKIFPKVKKRQNVLNEKRSKGLLKKERKQGKEEGHNLISWLIKYAFRNGTTVEECILAKKKADEGDKTIFDWIKNSSSKAVVSFDMWKYANIINNRHPNANIYRFYYHSEIFQCADTLFLFMFVFVIPFIVFSIMKNGIVNIQPVLLIVYDVLLFLFHRISKGSAKACIRRFFLEIAVGLTDCEDIHI